MPFIPRAPAALGLLPADSFSAARVWEQRQPGLAAQAARVRGMGVPPAPRSPYAEPMPEGLEFLALREAMAPPAVPITPEREPGAGEPGFGVLAAGQPMSAYAEAPPEEGPRLDWRWGAGVDLGPGGRPVEDTTIGEGSMSRPRIQAHESTGGGGFYQPNMEDIPLGQRPPSYWTDRGLELQDLAARTAMTRGTTELAREQPSAAEPGLTVGEEMAYRTDPERARLKAQQSIELGLIALARDVQLADTPEKVARAQEAYQTGQELAKLLLTSLAGRNLGFYGNDLSALLGGGLGQPAAPAR